jgi:hypothetical protein
MGGVRHESAMRQIGARVARFAQNFEIFIAQPYRVAPYPNRHDARRFQSQPR